MADHIVAREGDIPERGRKLVNLEGRPIGVFNVGGRYFALHNRCAHQRGPLCEGILFPRHSATVDANRRTVEFLDHDNPVLCCPWHGWEYDLESGRCLADETRGVRTYPVRVDGGEVIVSIEA